MTAGQPLVRVNDKPCPVVRFSFYMIRCSGENATLILLSFYSKIMLKHAFAV